MHCSCRSIELPFWLGTILPFAAAYVFNWIMFVIIIISLCRRPVKKENPKSKTKFVKQQATIAFGLVTLFGLGWGFGLAASSTTVEGLTFAFQIVFSVFIGLQGVLLFILHGIKKQEARKQWKLWLSTVTSKPSSTATLTTGSTALYSKAHRSSVSTHNSPGLSRNRGSFSKVQKDPARWNTQDHTGNGVIHAPDIKLEEAETLDSVQESAECEHNIDSDIGSELSDASEQEKKDIDSESGASVTFHADEMIESKNNRLSVKRKAYMMPVSHS